MKLNDLTNNSEMQVHEIEVSNISSNSNEIKEGGLFVALKGVKSDGADYVLSAEKNGAIAILAEHSIQANVPVIMVKNARATMAQIADTLYPSTGLKKVAVTGTNGKTSTVYYVAQLLNKLGVLSASMGTIGVDCPVLKKEGSMTTPDAVCIHKTLNELDEKGVKVVALEASSHGLDQERLAGVQFQVAAFTNITQDHLDYHQNMQAYFTAKMRLFLECLAPNGIAVLNADIPEFEQMSTAILAKGISIVSYGQKSADLKLISRQPTPNGQKIEVDIFGKRYVCDLNIVGDFQVSNILCAIGMCIGLGQVDGDMIASKCAEQAGEFTADKIRHLADCLMKQVPFLEAPVGRLERVGVLQNGVAVYVDYAHTPDALERVLKTMRPHTKNKLVCVFGCGGDRDKGKRPLMGEIANRLADVVYVTDDNPRTEEADVIRSEIKALTPKVIEIGDRHIAIEQAIYSLEEGDVLVIAGKGHEAGQKIGNTVYAFDDKAEACLAILKTECLPLWSADELKASITGDVPDGASAYGISIDTRSIVLGDMFVAIRGDKLDGHDYVAKAVLSGAAVCLVDHEVAGVPKNKQIIVKDVQVAFEQMAMFARNRSEAVFVGITGSSGKTTTKEMLKIALADQGSVYATAGNLNGKIGVPLTLCRLPRDVQYAIVEMGMDHLGDLTELSKLVRPYVTIITMIGSAHLAFFKGEEEIALAKSEIFIGQDKEGVAILNADSPYYKFLCDKVVENGIRFISSFGKNKVADFRLEQVEAAENETLVEVYFHGERLTYKIGFLGAHFAMNSLAVLGAVDGVGASIEQAAHSLAKASAVAGRGACEKVTLPTGKTYYLIDDSYNANPSSMAASIGTLGMHVVGDRIVLIGDMLELGEREVDLHTNLLQNLIDNKVSKVYAVGKLMKHLFDALPEGMKGVWKQTPEEIAATILNELPQNSTLLVKSSKSTGLLKIIPTLKGNC